MCVVRCLGYQTEDFRSWNRRSHWSHRDKMLTAQEAWRMFAMYTVASALKVGIRSYGLKQQRRKQAALQSLPVCSALFHLALRSGCPQVSVPAVFALYQHSDCNMIALLD
jgi:hypothetical protein